VPNFLSDFRAFCPSSSSPAKKPTVLSTHLTGLTASGTQEQPAIVTDVAKITPVITLRRMRLFFSPLTLSNPMMLKPLVKKFYFVGVIPEF
jgi:hypothetical protein